MAVVSNNAKGKLVKPKATEDKVVGTPGEDEKKAASATEEKKDNA